jgi:hypothetical protein
MTVAISIVCSIRKVLLALAMLVTLAPGGITSFLRYPTICFPIA